MRRLGCVLLMLMAWASVAMAQDVCGPAKVTGLTVTPGKTTVTVSWVNSGDDCNTGTATSFEVRRGGSSFGDGDWCNGSTIVATGSPGGNGTTQCVAFSSLSCGTNYYWAVFLIDEAGNRSPISSVVLRATNGCETSLEVECE